MSYPIATAPIGLYVHVPFCLQKCDYCSFYSRSGRLQEIPAFISALQQEIDGAMRRYGPLPVDTLYLGGGTPSLLDTASLALLLKGLRRSFALAETSEITLEVNPYTVDGDKAAAWLDMGINRVSVGVQALREEDLVFLGRLHSADQALASLDCLQQSGFTRLNADLLFGIPGQSVHHFREGLERLIQTGADHVSVYGLSIEENTPLSDRHRMGLFHKINDEVYEALFLTAHAFLEGAGFSHYEISNFAKPGGESRHNLNCWTGHDFLGFGPAAHSKIGTRRFANPSDLSAYLKNPFDRSFDTPLTEEQVRLERLMLGLRCREGVDRADVRRPDHLEILYKRHLVAFSGERLRLTPSGMLLMDEIVLYLEGEKCSTSK
ncbi:MAG: hypothetical protein A2293_04480 [Elusimicrobia bacterium RIFOXYB2_FULL_49_7]|nr:MAG: hypothetical protein A2293_04480 [Elusimicrobia bacterium RIFOXYB2_FULL_49_7]